MKKPAFDWDGLHREKRVRKVEAEEADRAAKSEKRRRNAVVEDIAKNTTDLADRHQRRSEIVALCTSKPANA